MTLRATLAQSAELVCEPMTILLTPRRAATELVIGIPWDNISSHAPGRNDGGQGGAGYRAETKLNIGNIQKPYDRHAGPVMRDMAL